MSKQRNDFFKGNESKIENELKDLQKKTTGIDLDYFVIMSNHVHIIFILQNRKLHLGEVVRRFKVKVSYAFGENVWQANYYEHVIRNDAALGKIRGYVMNNPQAAEIEFEQFYK